MNADDLQRALYNALTGDSGLMGKITGVYADVEQPNLPEDPALFPYVTFGGDTIAAWDTNTTLGGDADCQIDVWSRQNNLIEVKDIGKTIYSILHNQTLTIANADCVQCLVKSATFTRDPDGQTKRGLILLGVLYDGL